MPTDTRPVTVDGIVEELKSRRAELEPHLETYRRYKSEYDELTKAIELLEKPKKDLERALAANQVPRGLGPRALEYHGSGDRRGD